eukprot:ANDGO_06735.mRNA.1 axonemal
MSKSTVKDAIKKWEDKHPDQKAVDSEVVKLYGMMPPLDKCDGIQVLKNVRQLSLSTNCIEKISNLQGLDKLEILSLGRNNIKNLGGLEAVSDTLQQLWISYNNIEKLNGIEKMKNLRILYMANNKVASWAEFERLKQLPVLEELLFTGNPLERTHFEQGDWRLQVIRRLPSLKKLDGKPIDPEEREAAQGGEASA